MWHTAEMVDIKMKSNDYAKLPEQWKEYCVGTENATFPLIIIDDEVVWYGLPTAKWKFQVDKTTSMITVVHSMVRIKGKNTVEMIKALTDIETVVVGQNIRKLDNKKRKLVTNSFAASSGNLEDNGSILNALKSLPSDKRYKWAFEEGIPYTIDYNQGVVLKKFASCLK